MLSLLKFVSNLTAGTKQIKKLNPNKNKNNVTPAVLGEVNTIGPVLIKWS